MSGIGGRPDLLSDGIDVRYVPIAEVTAAKSKACILITQGFSLRLWRMSPLFQPVVAQAQGRQYDPRREHLGAGIASVLLRKIEFVLRNPTNGFEFTLALVRR